MAATVPTALPDFRNFGVMLRVAVLAEALRLVTVFAAAPDGAGAWALFTTQGLLYEPVLLSAMVSLFAAAPWLARLAYVKGVAVLLAGVAVLVLVWHSLLSGLAPVGDPVRAVALAWLVSAALLFYFSWRHLRLSPALAEARLLALQSRIQPHFLFNSLNSVLALIREDPRRAEAMLEDLADLFRAILADPRALVTLSEELALARSYADIEAIRLGSRLRVTWHVDAVPAEALVPPLILQPLLENAVRHGVEPAEAGADVEVRATAEGDYLVLSVRNSCTLGQSAPLEGGNHIALANIGERLALHFDAEASLQTRQSDGGFEVRVRLPVRRVAGKG